jgi:hypothetical protein
VTSWKNLHEAIDRLSCHHRQKHTLILSSHHEPEDSDDLLAKISYLHKLDATASKAKDARGLIEAMQAAYPGHKGMNYLEMTASSLMGGTS